MNGRKIFEDIKAKGFDAAIFLDEVSQYYLCDFYTTDGILFVTENETAIFTDARYFEAVEIAKKSGELSEDVVPHLLNKNIYELAGEFLGSIGAKSVAVDPKLVSVFQLEKLKNHCNGTEFGYCEDICLGYRRIKTAAEVEKIKKAQAITDKAFNHILGFISLGRTESEIASELEYFMKCNGATGLAFETIAVSGKNSSLPHGVPSNTEIAENSFLTMDYGAKYKGYCSDMTRTVVVGKADDEMKRIYNTVLTAQSEAIKGIRAGMKCVVADKIARDVITDAGYGKYFSHSLGHSLGLEIHEAPRVSTKGEDILVPGNIVTVEPGIYIPGKYGVRIENMILITENGNENLTMSDNALIEL